MLAVLGGIESNSLGYSYTTEQQGLANGNQNQRFLKSFQMRVEREALARQPPYYQRAGQSCGLPLVGLPFLKYFHRRRARLQPAQFLSERCRSK